MRVIDPGHKYALRHIDGDGEEIITYVKREGLGYPGNVGSHPGTILQEEIRAQIHRMKCLDHQKPHWRNKMIIDHFRRIMENLELRAAERHNRSPHTVMKFVDYANGPHIEDAPYCDKCGHVGCEGGCKG